MQLVDSLKRFWAVIVEYWTPVWVKIKPQLIRFEEWRKRFWKKYQVNKILILLALVSVLVTSVYLFVLAKSQNVGMLKAGLQQKTVVYDQSDQEAGTLGQKGTFVTIDEISPYVIDALVSTEDRRFYTHRGYDLKGIARAVVGKLTTGRITGGGSTITQQLAKNAYLNLDQTLTRKAKELFLSIEIEKTYSKDEILEMYLNNVYMANGVKGIEDASHRYFGKTAAELTVDEAAVLVGMLKGPEIYNPIDHYDNAIARRDTVLSVMVDNGKLTQEEADKYMSQQLYLSDNYNETTNGYRYPYYFDAVLNEVEAKTKISVEDLQKKGYKVYTYLNQNYQQGMDTSFANDYLFPPNAEDGEMVQGASIALNPSTGGVEAVVGGRGEKAYRDLNRATQASLSPGSTMKPLAIYTPALEAGYNADSILKDEPIDFYNVSNYDGQFYGDVTMHYALEQSLNVSAVWLMNKIGIDTSFNKVQKFGINLDEKDHYYGMGLGGLTKGTTPMRMASAYSVFANDGQQVPARFIRKIEDASGKIVYENETPKAKSVTSKKVADDMTSMMLGVFSNGSGASAKPYGYQMAGKTGTTENISSDGNAKDQWMIGYTPDVVVATWIGFDESSETHYLTGSSGQTLSALFKDQTERILANSPQTPFEVTDVNKESSSGFGETLESWKDKINDNLKDKVKDTVDENLPTIKDKIKEGLHYWKDQFSDAWHGLMNR
ncbi:transglycosylase domain-containing protein [Vagococcus zengguangii]|uniref:PBP1A family penicillin-binding protein n=1 Tax=Vagococcus zengguangii TaxID=2571750 RepID=A0A4D7CXX7_9ENTE|nr:PBP1A family penicillin-binding protein [Vagococcus zengguangii]TLG80517.1 PBP1A family penicillin-binding protein [Vagococcus zengguangii]